MIRSFEAEEPDHALIPGSKTIAAGQPSIILIERRALHRDCFARILTTYPLRGSTVRSYKTAERWQEVAPLHTPDLIVLCSFEATGQSRAEVEALSRASPHTPIAVLASREDRDSIVEALALGVRGYIPISLGVEVAIEAMHLVMAGGTYVPTTSLLSYQRTRSSEVSTGDSARFTARQGAVASALREGKTNRIIANELGMRESTVKAHVRKIMKKLVARNRTEAAFMIRDMALPGTNFRDGKSDAPL